jgi:hypothetical protein
MRKADYLNKSHWKTCALASFVFVAEVALVGEKCPSGFLAIPQELFQTSFSGFH